MAETIFGNGINQADLYDLLKSIDDEWEDLLENLDADALTSSAYESTYDCSLPATCSGTGLSQDDIVTFLDTFITNFNAVLAVLDADTTKTTVGYVAGCAITDYVNNPGTGNIFSDGINQGNLVYLLQHILTQFAALTTMLDADTGSGVTKTDYGTIASITDVVNTDGTNALIGGFASLKTIIGTLIVSTILFGYLLLLKPAPAKSEYNTNTQNPVYQARTLNAIKLYCVGGSTTTAATYQVFGSTGIEFTTTAGKYPGRHKIPLSGYTYDTLISSINQLSTTGTGTEGGWVAELAQGAYGGNPATLLSPCAAQSCLAVANIKTSTGTDTYGITYILPADYLAPEQQFHLTAGCINVTFGTGYTVTFYIYDGTTTANDILDREVYKVSGVDGHLDVAPNGECAGSENRAMRFDIACSSNISAGWLNLQLYKQ